MTKQQFITEQLLRLQQDLSIAIKESEEKGEDPEEYDDGLVHCEICGSILKPEIQGHDQGYTELIWYCNKKHN